MRNSSCQSERQPGSWLMENPSRLSRRVETSRDEGTFFLLIFFRKLIWYLLLLLLWLVERLSELYTSTTIRLKTDTDTVYALYIVALYIYNTCVLHLYSSSSLASAFWITNFNRHYTAHNSCSPFLLSLSLSSCVSVLTLRIAWPLGNQTRWLRNKYGRAQSTGCERQEPFVIESRAKKPVRAWQRARRENKER